MILTKSSQLYLNLRPYLKEMLQELRQDYEIIVFGSNYQYADKIIETVQKDEVYFDYVIKKEMISYVKNIDKNILDLNILLGSRDPKDIIVVSSTCRTMYNYTNYVPVKEYNINKKGLVIVCFDQVSKKL